MRTTAHVPAAAAAVPTEEEGKWDALDFVCIPAVAIVMCASLRCRASFGCSGVHPLAKSPTKFPRVSHGNGEARQCCPLPAG